MLFRVALARPAWLPPTLALLCCHCVSAGELRVDIDFVSGSGQVHSIDQKARVIRLSPSEHPDRGWACWWYVKVTGIEPGETITLEVGRAPWATPAQAAVSLDNQSWAQTAPGERRGDGMAYRHQVDSHTVWFAWGPPFTPADAARLVEQAARAVADGQASELSRTRSGNPIPAFRVKTATQSTTKFGVWIQARQHAWESGSSWVCQGLLTWLASADPRAVSLRSRAELVVVPIMDIDNVALGAGGKNQAPHDHNRDWGQDPHWPAVASAIAQIQQMDQAQQFDVFVDLHNPGPSSKQPFFYVTPRELLSPLGQRNLDRFLSTAQIEITGPLTFRGEARESGANYDPDWQRISKNWVSLNTSDHVVAVTLETAWNSSSSTTEGYRTVGRQLGQAIERYLRTDPRQTQEGGQEGSK